MSNSSAELKDDDKAKDGHEDENAPVARRRKSVSSDLVDALRKSNIKYGRDEKLKDEEMDGWPNLFDLSWSMNDASMIIYEFIAIRDLVRAGKLPISKSLLGEPQTLADVSAYLEEHKDLLEKYLPKKEIVSTEAALTRLKSRVDRIAAEKGIEGSYYHEFIAIDDENHTSELVYGIGINALLKRVIIVFRGTATLTDAKTDLQMTLKSIPNPMKIYDGQPETVCVHSGFVKYLYGSSASAKNVQNKCDSILSQLEEILTAFPKYDLYITGHSLGGALASLFAFSAACSDLPQIKKPVKCVSIASPKVGNEDFRSAFELLEAQNKLRYLRVVNDLDLIPMTPEQHIPITKTVLQNSAYRHVGIQLKLYTHKNGVRVTYRRLKQGLSRAGYDLAVTSKKNIYTLGMLTFGFYYGPKIHSCDEYTDRIMLHSDILKKLEIPSLYDLRLKDPNRDILFDAKKDKL